MEKENDKKNKENLSEKNLILVEEKEPDIKEIEEPTIEEKLEEAQDKLLRALADSENQRRRSEKKLKKLLNMVDLILLEKLYHFLIIYKEHTNQLRTMKV